MISQAPDRESAVAAAGARSPPCWFASNRVAETESFQPAGRSRLGNGDTWPPVAFRLKPELARKLAAMDDFGGAPAVVGAPITVARFDEAASVAGTDWSGRAFLESAELALRISGSRLAPVDRAVLAGRFWRAVAAGGAQAGLYVLDTESRRAGRARAGG